MKRIKILLIERDLTVAEIARRTGNTRQWISYVLHGHRKSQKTRKKIAAILGVPESEIWPDRRAA